MIALLDSLTPYQQQLMLVFLGGIGIALTCGVLSVFVVLKRLAFIGQGISHSAFGGAGLALLLGVWLYPEGRMPLLARDLIIALFCVGAALGIGFLSRRGKVSEDTAIGISLVAAMAVGVVMLDLRQTLQAAAAPPLESLLFGQIYMISSLDVIVAWVLAGLTLLTLVLTFKELIFFAFDEETAQVFGVRTRLFYYGLMVFLGVAVVAAMRTTGVILVSALLVLPGAAARLLANRIGAVTLLAGGLGVIGMVTGLCVNLYLDYLTPGPIIALTYCVIFVVCYVLRKKR